MGNMSEFYPKASEIVLNAAKNTESFCETFVYEPENIEEEKLGYLYVVGQITGEENSRKQSTSLLSFVASQISRAFFKKTGFSPKEALEKTLAEMNQILENDITSGKLGWIQEFNIAVVLLHPNTGDLCFVFNGNIQGLLWRKGQIIDIARQIGGSTSQETIKIFRTIASGKIVQDDKIIFSAPELEKKIPLKDLKSAIDQSRYIGMGHIKEILSLNQDDNLALLIVDLTKAPEPEKIKTTPLPVVIIDKEEIEKVQVAQEKPPVKKIITKKYLLVVAAFLVLMSKNGLVFAKKHAPKLKSFILKCLKGFHLEKLLTKLHIKVPKTKISLAKIDKKYIYSALFIVLLIIISFVVITYALPHKPVNKKTTQESVNGIQLLVDISKQTLSSNALGVFSKNSNIVTFDESSLYVFNLNTQKGDFIFPELTPGYRLAFQTETDNNLVYLSSQGEALVADKDLLSLEVKKASGLGDEIILDTAGFGNNVYMLTGSGKVLKYINLDFSKTSTWMNKGSDFGVNFLSLAIDGSVYVLEKAGIIHKYTLGEMDVDYLITVQGMAESGDKIVTRADFKNLYLMSKSQNKIIVFNKESRIQTRVIENTDWKELKNISITPDEKTIYLLDGLKVYKIDL
jgi:hypothetical protein